MFKIIGDIIDYWVNGYYVQIGKQWFFVSVEIGIVDVVFIDQCYYVVSSVIFIVYLLIQLCKIC